MLDHIQLRRFSVMSAGVLRALFPLFLYNLFLSLGKIIVMYLRESLYSGIWDDNDPLFGRFLNGRYVPETDLRFETIPE